VGEGRSGARGTHRAAEAGVRGTEGAGAAAEVAGASRGHRGDSRQRRGDGGTSSGDRRKAIGLCEVSRAPQQPRWVCGPGEFEGDGVREMPGSTQIVLVEHGREGGGGFDTSGQRNGGERKASGEACDKEENEDRDKHVPKGR